MQQCFKHAVQCGSGVACFLSLNTSLIVIVTRHKAALWGSVYLDAHGEEDRNLKLARSLLSTFSSFAKISVLECFGIDVYIFICVSICVYDRFFF